MINDHEIVGGIVYIYLVNSDGSVSKTMIDIEDLPKMMKYKFTWLKNNSEYVYTNTKCIDGMTRHLALHRYLMDPPKGMVVDHINHNTLDNRRKSNLRNVTYSENALNRKNKSKTSKSGYLGVHWNSAQKVWVAQCMINGKNHFLGSFIDKDEANEKIVRFRRDNIALFKLDA